MLCDPRSVSKARLAEHTTSPETLKRILTPFAAIALRARSRPVAEMPFAVHAPCRQRAAFLISPPTLHANFGHLAAINPVAITPWSFRGRALADRSPIGCMCMSRGRRVSKVSFRRVSALNGAPRLQPRRCRAKTLTARPRLLTSPLLLVTHRRGAGLHLRPDINSDALPLRPG